MPILHKKVTEHYPDGRTQEATLCGQVLGRCNFAVTDSSEFVTCKKCLDVLGNPHHSRARYCVAEKKP